MPNEARHTDVKPRTSAEKVLNGGQHMTYEADRNRETMGYSLVNASPLRIGPSKHPYVAGRPLGV